MINKQTFLDMIDFIKEKNSQQEELIKVFEKMCPGLYCDTLIYAEYEGKVIKLLSQIMEDESDLISYKFYEFDNFDESSQHEQLAENLPRTCQQVGLTLFAEIARKKDPKNTKNGMEILHILLK